MEPAALKCARDLVLLHVVQRGAFILYAKKFGQPCPQTAGRLLFSDAKIKYVPVIALIDGKQRIQVSRHIIRDVLLLLKDIHQTLVQNSLFRKLPYIIDCSGQVAFEYISIIYILRKFCGHSDIAPYLAALIAALSYKRA